MESHKFILDKLIVFMATIANHNKMTGEKKKKWVLKKLKEELNLNEDIENFIIELIDVLIMVDKNKIKINPVIKKSLLCCFKK